MRPTSSITSCTAAAADVCHQLGQRRNALAALVAVGCNIGPARMAAASGLSVWEISQAADWYLTADGLKAASVDLVNHAIHQPMSFRYGLGDTCSADGMRFYVPVDILAADFSHLLHGRGVTLYAHTGENAMRLYQQPIPCRLREATFVLRRSDGARDGTGSPNRIHG